MSLQRGRLVFVAITDEDGETKHRPAVVLTPTDEIAELERVTVVAVSTNPHLSPDRNQVALAHHPEGRCRSGLKKPSFAICTWLAIIRKDAIGEDDQAGILPGKELIPILKRIQELVEETKEG